MLLVGGTFDQNGGKPSKIVTEMAGILPNAHQYCAQCVRRYAINNSNCSIIINGGTFESLKELVTNLSETPHDAIIWMPNVSNDEEKLVNQIKDKCPKTILVTSKRNIGDTSFSQVNEKYSLHELIARMLKVKANLLIEIRARASSHAHPMRLVARVLDPLGNSYGESTDFKITIATVLDRINQLKKFTRIGSKQGVGVVETPDEPEFFEYARDVADVFHELIHPTSTERFLGNLSFRCERGFPSFRGDGKIFVSRRNIDKRFINKDGFVAVEPTLVDNSVVYYGDMKPSVDTPVQLLLYQYFTRVRYMLHSHVYVNGAKMTDSTIPCGAIEEFDEIIKVFPENGIENAVINLRGHGSLVLANSVSFLKSIKPSYCARPFPEIH